MKQIKNKRLRKKLHRKIINDLCMYGSLSREWRTKLFQAKVGEIFDFSQEDLIALFRNNPVVRKFKFQFSITIIPKNQAPLWLQEDIYGAVFKFYAKDFQVCMTYQGTTRMLNIINVEPQQTCDCVHSKPGSLQMTNNNMTTEPHHNYFTGENLSQDYLCGLPLFTDQIVFGTIGQ